MASIRFLGAAGTVTVTGSRVVVRPGRARALVDAPRARLITRLGG